MAKVKEVSSYSGSAWGTAVPIGANATNVDMATNPADYDSSTSETSTALINTNDVKIISSDTDLTAWGKFNRFRKRVANKVGTNTLETTAQDLSGGVNELKNTLNPIDSYFTPKKIMFITDSYGNQVTDNNKRIDQLVAEYLGITTSRISVSGGSLVRGEIKTAVDSYSGDSDYDTIILIMGANDLSNSDNAVQISSGMSSLVESIRSKFDAYNILCMCCGLTFSSAYITQARINLALNYKKACLNSKIKYVDNSQYLLCSTARLQNDLCHPNTAGIYAIAEACCHAIYNKTVDVVISTTTSGSSGASYLFRRHNGVVFVSKQGGSGIIASKTNITNGDGSAIEIFDTLNDSLVECSGLQASDSNGLPGWCVVNSAEVRLNACITISNKKIQGYVFTKGYAKNATDARVPGILIFVD